MLDLLLCNATVITMDSRRRVLTDGCIGISGSRIEFVGTRDEYSGQPAHRVIDCEGGLVLPGLINCHSHAGHCIMGKLDGELMSLWWPMLVSVYENGSDEAFWEADAQLHAVTAVRNGITTTVNVFGSTPMGDCPGLARSHARGYAGVGAREILGVGIPYAPEYPKHYTRFEDGQWRRRAVGIEEMLQGTEETLKTVHGAYDGLCGVFVTPHQQLMEHAPGVHDARSLTALTPMERNLNARVRELAKRYRTQIYTDTYGGWVTLAATDRENMLLGPDVLVGMEHVAAPGFRELRILRDTGTKVYYTAEGYYKRVPVCEAIQMGIPVGITTNGCAPRTLLDLLEALRRAVLSERIFHRDASCFPAEKALECITIDAARCIGREDSLGSIEPGKLADLAVVDMAKPQLAPLLNPVEQTVSQVCGGDFKTVLVNGRPVLEDYRLLTQDEPAILEQAEQLHQKLITDHKLTDRINPMLWGKTRMELI